MRLFYLLILSLILMISSVHAEGLMYFKRSGDQTSWIKGQCHEEDVLCEEAEIRIKDKENILVTMTGGPPSGDFSMVSTYSFKKGILAHIQNDLMTLHTTIEGGVRVSTEYTCDVKKCQETQTRFFALNDGKEIPKTEYMRAEPAFYYQIQALPFYSLMPK